MPKRRRIPTSTPQFLPLWGFLLLWSFMVGSTVQRIVQAEDVPPSPSGDGASQPIGEEIDIFKERQRQIAKQEKLEAKRKQQQPKVPSLSGAFSLQSTPVSDTGDGSGLTGRVSHLIGPTFGRPGSITPLEVMPYMLIDEHFFFSDLRGFITNSSQFGGNGGIGYRYLREDWNAWAGASLWYDADNSTSKLFQQVGLSFEALANRFELRSNVYLPVTSTQTISTSTSSAQIIGNQLIYGRNILMGTPMDGVDVEVGYSLPIRDQHILRGFVGGYFFESSNSSNVSGIKARVEGVISNTVTAQAMYTDDNLYGTNVMVGLSLQFPFGNRNPSSGWKRNTPSPFRFVERNYNVIVAQWHNNQENQVAKDPTTGQAYNVEQVYTGTNPNGGTPDGTTQHPFSSVADAQAAGGNLIIVQSGSVLNEAVTLTGGQHLLGQGAYTAYIPTQSGYVAVPMAAQAGNASQTPLFSNVNGNAVTLASNSEVAGFKFSGTSGDGILGNNAANVSLHDLTFMSTGGDAIHLTNSSGDVTLKNIQINGAGGNGIVLDGGNANFTYSGYGNSITAQGDGFVLSNLTGGTISIDTPTIKSTGGAGFRMDNVATDVTINNLSVSQSTGPAVAITGNTGTTQTVNGVQTNVYDTYNFNGFTTITSPNGAGFTTNGSDAILNIQALNVTSTAGSPAVSLVNNPSSAVTIGSLTLNTNNGSGLNVVGVSSLKISGGSITSFNAPAVNIQSSTVDVTLSKVSVDGGPFGIGLTQSTGVFTVLGSGTYGSGGVIQNTTNGVQINSFGTANLNWMDFSTNGTSILSTKSAQLNMQNLRISGSTSYAIDSMDDSALTLRNSTLTSNGSIGGGTIRVQADTLGTFQSMITNNTITDTNGTPISFTTQPGGAGASVASTIQSNTITGSRGSSSLISYVWNGPLSVAVSNNTLNDYASNSTAVLISGTSTTDAIAAQVNNNTITFASGASQGTAVYILGAATAQTAVAQNTIDFKAAGGTGLRYQLNGTSTNYIAANVITDEAGGITGMLFDNVAANSRLQIDGNTINMLATDLTTHRGIIFNAVSPTIQFSGTVNNLIYNAATSQTLFSIPVNSATGGFYINGTLE